MSTRTPIVAQVRSTEKLTPHLVPIVLESDGLKGFPVGEFTDHYVKLQLPPRMTRSVAAPAAVKVVMGMT